MFRIDISPCMRCGGAVQVIACIEDPAVICKILTHLDQIESRTAFTFTIARGKIAATATLANPEHLRSLDVTMLTG